MNPRDGGSALVVAMLGMVAVLAVAGLAMITVRGESVSLGRDRALRAAQYAAEGGVHVAADYLSFRCMAADGFTGIIASDAVNDLTAVYGNNVGGDNSCGPGECSGEPWFTEDGNVGAEPLDGTSDAEFDQDAYFNVNFFDNVDSTVSKFVDSDDTVVVRSTGYGPGGAQAMIIAMYKAEICTNAESQGQTEEAKGMDPAEALGAFTSDANASTPFTADLDKQDLLN